MGWPAWEWVRVELQWLISEEEEDDEAEVIQYM